MYKLTPIPPTDWPEHPHDSSRFGLWFDDRKDAGILVQAFHEANDIIRLSITNTKRNPRTGRFYDGLTWDQLQEIKSAVGYGERDAVEIYPADQDVVNIANMRHLWVLPQHLPFAWRNQHKVCTNE